MIVMEMEIDLRDYVDIVLRRWKVVLVVFLVAMVVAAVVSFLQPSIYEASVALVEERYEFYSGSRLQLADRQIVKLYPTLARTEAVENRVIEALESSLSPAEKTSGAVLKMVTVEENEDNPSLFEIRVRADDPDKAVLIANTWADQYMQMANNLETDWSAQLGVVEQELELADEALETFIRETGVRVVRDPGGDEAFIVFGARGLELERKAIALAEHRQARDNLLLLLETAQQVKEAGGGIEDLPLQLLNLPVIVDRGRLSVQVAKEQGDLDALIPLLQAEEEIISQVVDELATQVEQLQEELARDDFEYQHLSWARNLAYEAYAALSAQVREAQLFQSRTQVLSEAASAEKLVGRSPWLNVITAGVWGLLVGIMLALGLEYLGRLRVPRVNQMRLGISVL
jgi:capsular polysaccharide biosynthesis protein